MVSLDIPYGFRGLFFDFSFFIRLQSESKISELLAKKTLIDLLISKNYFVINIDKVTYSSNFYNTREHKNSKNYKFIKCDIKDKKIKKIIFKFKPAAIFNLAAETHVDRSIDDSFNFIRNNILGVYNLLENLPMKKILSYSEFCYKILKIKKI